MSGSGLQVFHLNIRSIQAQEIAQPGLPSLVEWVSPDLRPRLDHTNGHRIDGCDHIGPGRNPADGAKDQSVRTPPYTPSL